MKNLVFLFFFYCVHQACTSSPNPIQSKNELYSLSYYQTPVEELSKDQKAAFEALNTLQVSTDEKNKLYSTFANIEHPCYPPDSTFEISRDELFLIMQKFISKHCTKLESSVKNQLTQTSILAQDKYTVFYCRVDDPAKEQIKKYPLNGIWIFPSVLGRRDLLLHW